MAGFCTKTLETVLVLQPEVFILSLCRYVFVELVYKYGPVRGLGSIQLKIAYIYQYISVSSYRECIADRYPLNEAHIALKRRSVIKEPLPVKNTIYC